MNTSATRPAVDPKPFRTFAEFYPFYLGEHSKCADGRPKQRSSAVTDSMTTT
jgi:hypothetical protein